MYPSFIEDADGEEIENLISIVEEQSGETVHFLDMEIVQSRSLTRVTKSYLLALETTQISPK